jgi:long-chain acyl-CoA synthetase
MPDFDVARQLKAVFELDPAATALQYDGDWYTWGELARVGDELQATLLEIGVPAECAVGLIMRNRPAVVAATVSVLAARQSIVTLSAMQPIDGLARDVASLPMVAVAGPAEDVRRPEVLLAARESGVAVLELGAGSPAVTVLQSATLGSERLRERVAPGVAVQMLTSGTTGPPKRVSLTYSAFNAGFAALGHYQSGGSAGVRLRGGVALLSVPLLHVSGVFNLLLNFLDGRRISMLDRFSVKAWVALIEEHHPPTAALPPTAMRMVLDAKVPRESIADLKAVVAGTAPVSPDLAEEFERTYGVPVLVVYGATEFAGGIAGWTIADHREYGTTKRGSVGRAHPGISLRVVDPDSRTVLKSGLEGILEVRAAQAANAGPDGWVHTTDVAMIDPDGFLWIRGRADDVIIRGGFKVSTGAVAEVVKQHPKVRDAGVVGISDDRLGEVPVAAVELAVGAEFDRDELLDWLRDRLSPYQVPVDVIPVDELPRTPSLKVSQPGLRQLLRGRAETTA